MVEKESKGLGGCLILKIKKTNINIKTLSKMDIEKTGQSCLDDLVVILKFRD